MSKPAKSVSSLVGSALGLEGPKIEAPKATADAVGGEAEEVARRRREEERAAARRRGIGTLLAGSGETLGEPTTRKATLLGGSGTG